MKFNLKTAILKAFRLLFTYLLAIAATAGLALGLPGTAFAIPDLKTFASAHFEQQASPKLQADLDAVVGEDDSAKIEGKVQNLSETVRGKVDEAADVAKQQTAQAKDRVREDAESATGAANETVVNTAQAKNSLIDDVKDFFKG